MFYITVNLKENVSFVLHLKGVQFFPIFPECQQFSQCMGPLNPVPKRDMTTLRLHEKKQKLG